MDFRIDNNTLHITMTTKDIIYHSVKIIEIAIILTDEEQHLNNGRFKLFDKSLYSNYIVKIDWQDEKIVEVLNWFEHNAIGKWNFLVEYSRFSDSKISSKWYFENINDTMLFKLSF